MPSGDSGSSRGVTHRPAITLIAAMDRNRLIGRDGQMPWHLPADFDWFKSQTMGKPIVMGRKTFAAIGRPLPGRRNLVLTRQWDWEAAGVEVIRSVDEINDLHAPEVMIIGGAQLYEQLISSAERLLITHIDADFGSGDAFFPAIDPQVWHVVSQHDHSVDDRNAHHLTFSEYRRVDATA